jgi:uncharacterized membrane protein YfcA
LLVPPIGILAAWNYYQKGYVDLAAAALIAAGFVLASELASRFAVGLSPTILRRIFAVVLDLIAIEMFANAPRS